MKKYLAALAAAILCGLAIPAQADLVWSDPYPLEADLTDADPVLPEGFTISVDGAPAVAVPVDTMPDGRVRLYHDLGDLNPGRHVLIIRATHSMWGESDPLSYAYRGGPPRGPHGTSVQK